MPLLEQSHRNQIDAVLKSADTHPLDQEAMVFIARMQVAFSRRQPITQADIDQLRHLSLAVEPDHFLRA